MYKLLTIGLTLFLAACSQNSNPPVEPTPDLFLEAKSGIVTGTLDLGEVSTGSKLVSLTVKNNGTESLIGPAILDNANFSFVSGFDCNKTLVKGASCTMKLSFTATGKAPGEYVTNLNLDSVFAELKATVPAPVVPANPVDLQTDLIDFGTVLVGTNSGSKTLTVKNISSASLTLSQIAVPSGYSATFDGCNGKVIAKNATCSIKLTYSAAMNLVSGVIETPVTYMGDTANFKVTINNPSLLPPTEPNGPPVVVAPVLVGVYNSNIVTDVNFGTFSGSAATQATIYIRNNGLVVSPPLDFTLNNANFSIAYNQCNGLTLAKSASCQIRVIFSAAGKNGPISSILSGNGLSVNLLAQVNAPAEVVTFRGVYSNWNTCSAIQPCDGVGLKNRTLDNCERVVNGIPSGQMTDMSSCAGLDAVNYLQQTCNSPAGPHYVDIGGGRQTYQCSAGDIQPNFVSVSCEIGFSIDGQLCKADLVCNSDEHVDMGVCVSNTKTCDLGQLPWGASTGHSNWDNVSGWSSCIIDSCDTGRELSMDSCVCSGSTHDESGMCSPNERNCSPADTNATAGNQIYENGMWANCLATACTGGYQVENGACIAAASCSEGTHAEGMTCVANYRSCNPVGDYTSLGQQSWDGSWSNCEAVSCQIGFDLNEMGVCLSNMVSALSSTFTFLKDMNTDTTDSANSNFILNNDSYYFTAQSKNKGIELWRSDFTGTGTYLVKDLTPGINSSFSLNYPLVGASVYNQLFYLGNKTTSGTTIGQTLFVSDGSSSGTKKIVNLMPGSPSVDDVYSNYNSLPIAGVNGVAVFFAQSTNSNYQLYGYDGTNSSLIKVINTSGSAIPVNDFNNAYQPAISANKFSAEFMKERNGYVYFSANDGVNGTELWRTDGTQAGTSMYKDLSPGVDNSGPLGGYCEGYEWVTEEEECIYSYGSQWNYYIPPVNSSGPMIFIETDNHLYALAGKMTSQYGDVTNTIKIIEIGDTPATTVVRATIQSGGGISDYEVIGDTIYFLSSQGYSSAKTMYKFSGTTAMGFNPPSNDGPNQLVKFHNQIYFTYNNYEDNSNRLYRYNDAINQLVAITTDESFNYSSVQVDLSFLKAGANALYFQANNPANNRNYVYMMDSSETIQPLVNVSPDSPYSASLNTYGNKGVVLADDSLITTMEYMNSGQELVRILPQTTNNISLIRDINRTTGNFYASYRFEQPTNSASSKWIGVGPNSNNTQKIWVSDGTTNNTNFLNIPSAPQGFRIERANAGGTNKVFFHNYMFSNNAPSSNNGMWESDGTVAGTKQISSYTNTGYSSDALTFGDTVYFTGENSSSLGSGQWTLYTSSNGNTATSTGVTYSGAPGHYSHYNRLKKANGYILFPAYTNSYGMEVMRYNPSVAVSTGTLGDLCSVANRNPCVIGDIRAGANSPLETTNPLGNSTVIGNYLIFMADNGLQGGGPSMLYSTNGGTPTLLYDSSLGGSNIGPWYPKISGTANGYAWIVGLYNGGANRYLVRTQGTVASTKAVNVASLGIYTATNFMEGPGGKTYFVGTSSTSGTELFSVDANMNISIVKDINPGANSAGIHSPKVINNKLYFTATNGVNGYEIWTSDGTSAGTFMIEDSYPGPMPTDTSVYPEIMGNIGNKLLLRIFNPNYGWDLHYYNAP